MGAVDLQNLKNWYTMQPTKVGGIQTPPPAEFTPTTEISNGNLFSGNYEGINQNLGIGSQISYPPQAGHNRNGRTLAFG
ncbi:MAG: hypothetical protein E7Z92_02925 [Cyanobacteria bacterium SIG31]|nr:hypothetical protein [Cyanobacteria bacterium SIG31]